MERTIITVKEIVWPAQGKKQGKVIDTGGTSWQVWADKLGGYRVGASYELTEVQASEFNGRTYHTIKTANPVAVTGGAAGIATSIPKANGARPHEHTMDHERRLDIFCCGAVNAILGHPSIDPLTFTGTQMIDTINKLKYVWKQTLGPNAPQQPLERGAGNAAFSDEIPFAPETR